MVFKSYGLAEEKNNIGWVERENAKCIECSSMERHRLQFLYLTNKTNLFDDHQKIKLLHFAPEKAFIDIFSNRQHIEYIPCDLFPERYNFKDKIKVLKVNITEIPFQDNFFDVILCNHVLEHVVDDKLAMSELYRVMKKGGWGIFQVPLDYGYKRETTYEDFTITTPKERERAFGQWDHVRLYGDDYKDRLQSVGFKVTVDDYIKTFSEDELFKFGLLPFELIYYCQK